MICTHARIKEVTSNGKSLGKYAYNVTDHIVLPNSTTGHWLDFGIMAISEILNRYAIAANITPALMIAGQQGPSEWAILPT